MKENGLAKNIRYYRKQKGLSQETLAEYMGVSRQAVTKWENSISRPSSENLIKLAELFGVSMDVLLGNEEPNDFASNTKITTGNMPWIFIGISVICILTYLFISVHSDIFSIGTLICMFILFIPIQLFLHIYFTNAINTGAFDGIAGFDARIDYNIIEVKKMLVQINLHIGVTSTIYIFLFSAVNCVNLGIEWLNGLLMGMYLFDFVAVILINNYKMTDRIYRNDADKKRARRSMPVIIIYFLLMFAGMGTICFIFEMKGIENNTLPAIKLCGQLLVGVAIATAGLLIESRRIKKWDSLHTKYRTNKFSIVCVCLCVIMYLLMFF